MPQSTPSPLAGDLAQAPYFRLLTEIGIIAQLSAARLQRVLPHELTAAQFSLLHHCVRLGDGWTPARLAGAFQVTRGTMTSTLQKLERKGFVRIEADAADGRSKRVFLSRAGRAAHAAALTALEPEQKQLAAVLPEAEIANILPALEALRIWLDANR